MLTQATPGTMPASRRHAVLQGRVTVRAVVAVLAWACAAVPPLPCALAAGSASPERSSALQTDERHGFRPPPPGAMVTQVLVPWRNARTGASFVAPTGGWQPPNEDWVVVDDVPASDQVGPGGASQAPPPGSPTMSR